MTFRKIAQIFATVALSVAAATSRAEVGDQELRHALSELVKTTAKLKVTVEILKGAKVFETYCFACHGPEVPLPSIAQSTLMREPNAELVKFILYSKSGAKHPAWHMALSPIDVSNVANLLLAAFKNAPTELVSPESVIDVIASHHQKNMAECTPSK
jgi:cytochrome c553